MNELTADPIFGFSQNSIVLQSQVVVRFRSFEIHFIMASMASGSKLQLEPGSWLETAYDVYIGSVVGASHSFKICAKWWFGRAIAPVLSAAGFQVRADKVVQSADGEKTLKVVAVGYGRTGTVRNNHGQ
jgi:hypothetical protein